VSEPTRERVEAYEKALGCERGYQLRLYKGHCRQPGHSDEWTDLGCPVAVVAARVEAEETAALRSALERIRVRASGTAKFLGTPCQQFASAIVELIDN
jgi:hypothetical protein